MWCSTYFHQTILISSCKCWHNTSPKCDWAAWLCFPLPKKGNSINSAIDLRRVLVIIQYNIDLQCVTNSPNQEHETPFIFKMYQYHSYGRSIRIIIWVIRFVYIKKPSIQVWVIVLLFSFDTLTIEIRGAQLKRNPRPPTQRNKSKQNAPLYIFLCPCVHFSHIFYLHTQISVDTCDTTFKHLIIMVILIIEKTQIPNWSLILIIKWRQCLVSPIFIFEP